MYTKGLKTTVTRNSKGKIIKSNTNWRGPLSSWWNAVNNYNGGGTPGYLKDVQNYFNNIVVPFAIIFFYIIRQKSFQYVKIVRALTYAIHPLFTYMLLTYFLEMENYMKTEEVVDTLFFFFIPYVIIILIMNIVIWIREKKSKVDPL